MVSGEDKAAPAPPPPQCADDVDNDGDSHIDMADVGCNDVNDTDETNAAPSGGGPSTGSGSSSGGGGGGGGGSGGVIAPASAIAIATSTGTVLGTTTALLPALVLAPTESCDTYVTAFIKSGANNDARQVQRLQYVLRDFEGATIAINGVYDAVTLAAVHAFQSKYESEILTPWGITQSTGYVYLTTRKKVNEVYCRGTKQFPLTAQELQTIQKSRSTALPASTVPRPTPPRGTGGATSPAPAQGGAITASDAPESSAGKSFLGRILQILRWGR